MVQTDIRTWNKCMLDTSFINRVVSAASGNTEDSVRLFAYELYKFLDTNEGRDDKSRQFYISAITISEILRKSPEGIASN